MFSRSESSLLGNPLELPPSSSVFNPSAQLMAPIQLVQLRPIYAPGVPLVMGQMPLPVTVLPQPLTVNRQPQTSEGKLNHDNCKILMVTIQGAFKKF